MPSSDYRAAVDRVQAAIRPWLRDRGFGVRGRAFNRTTDDQLTQVVAIQMGPFDPPGMVEIPGLRENLYGWFTVNLGVYIPEVALYHGGGPAKSWVQEYYCAIRTRLGQLSSEERDLWWRAEASADVVDDLVRRLSTFGLPWLRRFETRDDIIREFRDVGESPWCTTPRITLALIDAARGNAANARQLLTQQVAEAIETHPRHAEYVRELSNRLGLGNLDA